MTAVSTIALLPVHSHRRQPGFDLTAEPFPSRPIIWGVELRILDAPDQKAIGAVTRRLRRALRRATTTASSTSSTAAPSRTLGLRAEDVVLIAAEEPASL